MRLTSSVNRNELYSSPNLAMIRVFFHAAAVIIQLHCINGHNITRRALVIPENDKKVVIILNC